jgi:UDP-2,3-diacylglucosamine pyrophosphatase LpxH
MKFRVISDLHVEFYAHPQYLQKKLNKLYPVISPDEILIIAGDLGVAGSGVTKLSMNEEYRSMLQYFSKRWNTVILVPGNHEYYDRDRYCKLEHVDAMIEFECKKLGIVFLNKNAIKIKEPKDLELRSNPERSSKESGNSDSKNPNLYVLGCTLWSEATSQAYKGMNDKLKAILCHKELISTHNEHKDWLEYNIHNIQRKDKHAKILIITHHLPLYELTHPKYLTPKYKPLNSAYASDLSLLMDSTNQNIHQDKQHQSICFWCCGHTHEMTRATHKGINFFINPMGYPRESRVTKTQNEIIEF